METWNLAGQAAHGMLIQNNKHQKTKQKQKKKKYEEDHSTHVSTHKTGIRFNFQQFVAQLPSNTYITKGMVFYFIYDRSNKYNVLSKRLCLWVWGKSEKFTNATQIGKDY